MLFYYTLYSFFQQIPQPHIKHLKQHIQKFFPNKSHFLSKNLTIIVHITELVKKQQNINHKRNHEMFNRTLQSDILTFIATYGEAALQEAMQQYVDEQQEYICKTKTQTTKIKIHNIYYLKIKKHNITIHTNHGTYKKYGTLNHELTILSPYGFIKCNQSCIVSLSKIRTIQNNDIVLINDTILHISRLYAPKLLAAFNRKIYSSTPYHNAKK